MKERTDKGALRNWTLGWSGARARLVGALIVLALAAPAWSQSRTVSIDRDLRLFTMMAAINAAGFDVELGGNYHVVRAELRKIAAELDPALLARMRQFYASHKGGQPDELQLPKYLGLALLASGPPNFSVELREEFMPPDARSVLRFADFLKEFYVKARIPERWVLAKPFYDHEAEMLGPPVRDAIRRADAYLRATTGIGTVRQMVVHVEMGAPKNTVNVQNGLNNEYHVIVGSSATPRTADIRHAYLHMSLDAALSSTMSAISDAQSLVALVAREEGVAPEHVSDLFSMTRESLIRAIELRLDRPPAAEATSAANAYYRSGLLLLPFFQAALPAYEQDETSLPAYLPTMLKTLRVKDEQKRFENSFHKITPSLNTRGLTEPKPAPPSPFIPPPEPLNPMRQLLADAQEAFKAGDLGKARALFDRVLESHAPDNGTAHYGLALIAGREGDDSAARKHFEGVLGSPSADNAMKTWTHVYLGRMDDTVCDRAHAVEHYQEAIRIGDNTNNAQSFAKEGVARSFNDACDKP